MEQYYYLFLDCISFIVPFLFSFEKRWMNFSRFSKPFWLAIGSVGFLFILWDIYFTVNGIWGFNNRYILGINLFSLPLEEWLFFLLIPYASIFIHYSLQYFFPKMILSEKLVMIINYLFLISSIIILFLNFGKAYTTVVFTLFLCLVLLQIIIKPKYLKRFFISFVIIYIPFFIVNSALTGSFTPEPVVYYNDHENLGIRLGTMPLEDSFYCYTLLSAITWLFEYLKQKFGYEN